MNGIADSYARCLELTPSPYIWEKVNEATKDGVRVLEIWGLKADAEMLHYWISNAIIRYGVYPPGKCCPCSPYYCK